MLLSLPPEAFPPVPRLRCRTRLAVLPAPCVLLLVAIGRYTFRSRSLTSGRPGLSEPEIQKLAYLLAAQGAPFPRHFSRGRYGPYSEELANLLHALRRRRFTTPLDRTDQPGTPPPVALAPGAEALAERILADYAELEAQIDAHLRLIDGFESPFGIELLSTVHQAAHEEPATCDLAELANRVRSWNQRTTRLHSLYHLDLARQRLRSTGLLPPETTTRPPGPNVPIPSPNYLPFRTPCRDPTTRDTSAQTTHDPTERDPTNPNPTDHNHAAHETPARDPNP